MYERFTDRARKVMQLANNNAVMMHHEYIGTEHVLWGLAKEDSGVAANVLKNLGVTCGKIMAEIEKIVQPAPDECRVSGKLHQTPRMKVVIQYAIEEARSLGHNWVGTEHLCLGLIREHEGVAAQVLEKLGVNAEKLREEVLRNYKPKSEPCEPTCVANVHDWQETGVFLPVIGKSPMVQACERCGLLRIKP